MILVVGFKIPVTFLVEMGEDGHDFTGGHAQGVFSSFFAVW